MKTFKIFLILMVSTVFLLFSGCFNKSTTQNKNVIGQTAIITKSTFVFEQPNEVCNNFQPLEQGNLIRIISIENKNWYYIEPVCLGDTLIEGYVNKKYFTFDLKNNVPNQGYINKEDLYEKPDAKSRILFKDMSGVISIDKRENDWAYCSYPGGKEDVWIKEADISYLVPDVLVK